jgi:ABC-type antimicrobial peptide transport system permease subunit
MVMRDSLVVCAMGLGFGLPLTFLGAGLMGSMLYKVSPLDLVSLGLAMSCVALVAVAASFLPARRAAKVDPMVALRYE